MMHINYKVENGIILQKCKSTICNRCRTCNLEVLRSFNFTIYTH